MRGAAAGGSEENAVPAAAPGPEGWPERMRRITRSASRLALARLTRDVLVKLLYLLGIEAPEAMLKA